MRATVRLRNVVGEAEHLFGVESFHCIATSTPIVAPFGAVLAGRIENVRMQHRFRAIDVLDETLDATGKGKQFFLAGTLIDEA